MKVDVKKLSISIILVLVALISFTYVGRLAASPESSLNRWTVEQLDEKKETVQELVAVSAGVSVAISAIPDDIGSPIAQKIADVAGYLVISLGAIYAEKYLLTIIGGVVFQWIIPICCIILAFTIWLNKPGIQSLCMKVMLAGLLMYGVMPASEKLSQQFWDVYYTSISETIEGSTVEDIVEEEIIIEEEEVHGLEKIGAWFQSAGEKLSEIAESVTTSVSEVVDYARTLMNNFVEATAIMLVTTCLFPVLVFLVMKWLIEMIFQMQMPSIGSMTIVNKTAK